MKVLSHTGIEYVTRDGRQGYGWNFYPGCLHKETGVCPVKRCWAESMSKRHDGVLEKAPGLPKGSLDSFHHPRLVPELLLAPMLIKKPSVIFANPMGDLGGEWVDFSCLRCLSAGQIGKVGLLSHERILCRSLREWMFLVMSKCPKHRFLFLTKNPKAWQKWNPWPDNAWVGATVCNQDSLMHTIYEPNTGLRYLKAKHKWLSIEPLKGNLGIKPMELKGIDWLVIGQETPVKPETTPKIEWIKEIVEAADMAGVKVWLKDNMYDLLAGNLDNPKENGLLYEGFWGNEKAKLRQEVPWG